MSLVRSALLALAGIEITVMILVTRTAPLGWPPMRMTGMCLLLLVVVCVGVARSVGPVILGDAASPSTHYQRGLRGVPQSDLSREPRPVGLKPVLWKYSYPRTTGSIPPLNRKSRCENGK
jgi:hypothetical protein